MRCLPRRVLSFALVVCFACTPSAMLACAVICVPGMMSHGAMLDVAPVAAASGHEHMHHAPAPAAASARPASHHDRSHHAEAVALATVVASSTDAVGPVCCTHSRASAGASTRASRADTAVVAAPAAGPVFVVLPPARAVASARAALNDHGFPSPPTHAPIVLRI